MLIDIFLLPSFLFGVILVGITASRFCALGLRTGEALTKDPASLGFLGFLAIGIVSLITSIWSPVTSPWLYGFLSLTAVLGLWSLLNEPYTVHRKYLYGILVSSLAAVPMVSVMGPGYDGGLYHLPHQLWLRNEPLVFGLANLHGRFGFNSLMEYLNAVLWIDTNLKLLPYVQAGFVVFLAWFITFQCRRISGPHLLLLLAILLSLIVFIPYMPRNYTSTDIPSGVLFIVAFVYGYYVLNLESEPSRTHWAMLGVFSVGAILFKLSAVPIVAWASFVAIYTCLQGRSSAGEVVIGCSVPAALVLIWSVASVITSGCVAYPLAASCVDVPWSARANAITDSKWITAWARHPRSGLYSLESSEWLVKWWLDKYRPLLWDVGVVGILTVLVYRCGGRFLGSGKPAMACPVAMAYAGFALGSLGFWFWSAPNPRFGLGPLVLGVPLLLLPLLRMDKVLGRFHKHRGALILTSFTFTVLFFKPWSDFESNRLLADWRKDPVPVPQVENVASYGVRPSQGDRCWLIPKCSPQVRRSPASWGNRTIFLPVPNSE